MLACKKRIRKTILPHLLFVFLILPLNWDQRGCISIYHLYCFFFFFLLFLSPRRAPWSFIMEVPCYLPKLLFELNEQRKRGYFCDCSILVEGRVFKAHRNVLFAGSGYFRALLVHYLQVQWDFDGWPLSVLGYFKFCFIFHTVPTACLQRWSKYRRTTNCTRNRFSLW